MAETLNEVILDLEPFEIYLVPIHHDLEESPNAGEVLTLENTSYRNHEQFAEDW